MSLQSIDLEILKTIVYELSPVLDQLVFIGGATVSLYIDEPQHVDIRETLDVDCVVEVNHRNAYETLSQRLRDIGFSEDMNSEVTCRFKKGDMILDVIPTDPKILGFSNIWYVDGFKNHVVKKVETQDIKVFALPYLVASKIEAFKGRGKNHFTASHDLEDIVTLFDGCSKIVTEIQSSGPKVRSYLQVEFNRLINNSQFISSLDAHISDRENLTGRKSIILSKMHKVALPNEDTH
jgi:predicted nucleotidyltransferase